MRRTVRKRVHNFKMNDTGSLQLKFWRSEMSERKHTTNFTRSSWKIHRLDCWLRACYIVFVAGIGAAVVRFVSKCFPSIFLGDFFSLDFTPYAEEKVERSERSESAKNIRCEIFQWIFTRRGACKNKRFLQMCHSHSHKYNPKTYSSSSEAVEKSPKIVSMQ